jgi:hypothetical protein
MYASGRSKPAAGLGPVVSARSLIGLFMPAPPPATLRRSYQLEVRASEPARPGARGAAGIGQMTRE